MAQWPAIAPQFLRAAFRHNRTGRTIALLRHEIQAKCRNGSKADIPGLAGDVRFAPQSGPESGHRRSLSKSAKCQ